MRNRVYITFSFAAFLVFTGLPETCEAQSETKMLDIKAIGEIIGVKSWVEERKRTRTEKLTNLPVSSVM